MNLSNRFTVEASIQIEGRDQDRLFHYLNDCHTGAPTVPLDAEVAPWHKEAVSLALMSRRVRLDIEVDRDGNWHYVSVNGRGIAPA